MSAGKYSPSTGDIPSNHHQESTTSAAAPPIDLFADGGQTSAHIDPPPNDVYIGDLVTSNTSSSMQPGMRNTGSEVVIMPSESRTRQTNNGSTTFQQPQHHPSVGGNNSTLNVPGASPTGNNDNNEDGMNNNGNNNGISQLPEHIQQEWDNVTEVTVLSSRLRILFVFVLLVNIVNAIALPWALFALPFLIAGYLGARWFKYYYSMAGMLTFVVMIPISIVTATQVDEEGFARFVLILLCIVAVVWHAYVGYTNYKFIQVLKKLSAENLEQVQHEMPAVCGCL